jgi:hypothetical protein
MTYDTFFILLIVVKNPDIYIFATKILIVFKETMEKSKKILRMIKNLQKETKTDSGFTKIKFKAKYTVNE